MAYKAEKKMKKKTKNLTKVFANYFEVLSLHSLLDNDHKAKKIEW